MAEGEEMAAVVEKELGSKEEEEEEEEEECEGNWED